MIIFFIEALFCFLFTVLLYFKYAMKNTRLYVTLLVISVWFLTFLTAIIVPFDIYLVILL